MTSRHALTLVIALWLRQVSLRDAADSQHMEGKASFGSSGRPQVLYVLECEGVPEWQAIRAGDEAVDWVRRLKDRLTVSQQLPDGEDVTIPAWWVHKTVQPLLEPLKGTEHMDTTGGISLFNVVEAQLMEELSSVWLPKYLLVLFQMTLVSGGPAVEDLHVTASKSFWQTVEATAAAKQFLFKATNDSDPQPVPSIEGYAVLLPTILSVMYGQGEWPEESLSRRYGDHSAWDKQEIMEMLHIFFSVTQAVALPDLEEYHWRSDKIALYKVFQQYYEQNPTKHAAPIPTVFVTLPVNTSTHRSICYEQRYLKSAKLSDCNTRDTAAAILQAAIRLEVHADASAIQSHNPDVGNSTLRKYILKRNHSGFARKVIRLSLDLRNWQNGGLLRGLLGTATGQQSKTPSKQHHSKSSINQTNVEPSAGTTMCDASSHAHNVPDPMDELMILNDAATDPVQFEMPVTPTAPPMSGPLATPSAPHGSPGLASNLELSLSPKQDSGTKEAISEVQSPLHDAQQLLAAGEHMVRESCGEDWLLQPLIPDMGSNEYRVNLIGGSQANGTATDIAVVFTPAKAADRQLYMYNLTLPHGFFSRSPLGATDLFMTFNIDNKYNSTKEEEYRESYFPYPVWKEPAMHQVLVDVALGGAQAFILSQRPARMSHNVLLRIDIALTQHDGMVRPFINEAHYYADATLMFPVWPPEPKAAHLNWHGQAAQHAQQHTPDAVPQEVSGWGLWLAEHLWKEAKLRISRDRQHLVA